MGSCTSNAMSFKAFTASSNKPSFAINKTWKISKYPSPRYVRKEDAVPVYSRPYSRPFPSHQSINCHYVSLMASVSRHCRDCPALLLAVCGGLRHFPLNNCRNFRLYSTQVCCTLLSWYLVYFVAGKCNNDNILIKYIHNTI
jgi:hypothetical protein